VPLPRSSRTAVFALAAAAVPVPLALANTNRARSTHRVGRARVVAQPHKLAAPKRPLPETAAHALKPADRAGVRPTLVFHVSRSKGGKGSWQDRRHHRIAHLAGDPSDTISDFKFTPASITIHVGDTITWVNNGPTDHTATDSGVFDTGLLHKGQSASHTFNQAGTFAYICTLHPFMHGTVVVVGNSSSNSGSNSGSNSTSNTGSSSGSNTNSGSSCSSGSTAGTTAAQSSSSSLPMTGLDLSATLGTALLLLGLGTALSRRSRTQR
jgi:plastocyanin